MKAMTCRQLGGACDVEFRAGTFEEMAALSREHGMEMLGRSDPDHLKAMEDMRSLMADPAAMAAWFEERRLEFEALPDVD